MSLPLHPVVVVIVACVLFALLAVCVCFVFAGSVFLIIDQVRSLRQSWRDRRRLRLERGLR
jgi:hypothetical protein